MVSLLSILILIFSLPTLASTKRFHNKFSIIILGKKNPKTHREITDALSRTTFLKLLNKENIKNLRRKVKYTNGRITGQIARDIGKYDRLDYIVVIENNQNGAFRLLETREGEVLSRWPASTKKNLKKLLNILETERALYELIHIKTSKSKGRTVLFGDIECMKFNEINRYIDEVEDDKSNCQFHIKENIRFSYRVVRDNEKKRYAYLTVLLYTTNGRIIQLFPNKHALDNRITTGQENQFPTVDAKYKLFADYPIGKDRVVFIASVKPVGLPGDSPRAGIYKYSQNSNLEKSRQVFLGLKKLPENGYAVKNLIIETTK